MVTSKERASAEKERFEREYAWAKWWRQKERVNRLESKIDTKKEDLKEINQDLERTEEKEEQSKTDLEELEYELENLHRDLIHHEKKNQNYSRYR